jgi:hypothetical protein
MAKLWAKAHYPTQWQTLLRFGYKVNAVQSATTFCAFAWHLCAEGGGVLAASFGASGADCVLWHSLPHGTVCRRCPWVIHHQFGDGLDGTAGYCTYTAPHSSRRVRWGASCQLGTPVVQTVA